VAVTRPTTTASFGAKCPGCGEWIEEGDDIFLVEGEWVCVSCSEEAGTE
jgi:formylmethanofuran dehydrogenase subunit E